MLIPDKFDYVSVSTLEKDILKMETELEQFTKELDMISLTQENRVRYYTLEGEIMKRQQLLEILYAYKKLQNFTLVK